MLCTEMKPLKTAPGCQHRPCTAAQLYLAATATSEQRCWAANVLHQIPLSPLPQIQAQHLTTALISTALFLHNLSKASSSAFASAETYSKAPLVGASAQLMDTREAEQQCHCSLNLLLDSQITAISPHLANSHFLKAFEQYVSHLTTEDRRKEAHHPVHCEYGGFTCEADKKPKQVFSETRIFL